MEACELAVLMCACHAFAANNAECIRTSKRDLKPLQIYFYNLGIQGL